MALNLESLSITSVFNSIVNFFKSQENNTRWKDLTSGAEGTFLIRLLSNVFSALSYRIVAQLRENFLSTAKLPSSNTALAVNLQYSVFRGSNLKRRMRVLPTGDYTFPKLSVIGQYSSEYDIITLEDVNLERGIETDVNVVIGKVKEETFKPGTSAIKTFSLFTTGISEDYTLFVNSIEVPTTKIMKEMTEDKYLVRTNPYLSVDIIYLNTYPEFKYKYGTDTEITIRYVELADVPVVPFTANMFTYGILQDTSTTSPYLPFEDVSSIKVSAPIDHELQNLIRSKADYAKRIAEIIPAVIDADYIPLTPTYTLITYLKNDLTLLSEAEKEKVNTLLAKENFFGTPLPDITYPRRSVANIDVNIALKNKYKNIADINLDVANLLANKYELALGITFNTYDFEREVEKLSYVRYARVNHKINTRDANTNYQIGYILNYEDNYYMVSQILGLSGATEPNWNVPFNSVKTIDTGLETRDGSLIWRAYKMLPNMSSADLSEWQRNFNYGIGEYVYTNQFPNFMFKCVDIIKSSGYKSPDLAFVSEKDIITDGGLVWVVKSYMDAPNWSAYTNYSLGDTVNILGNTKYSLECISYTGTTGTVEDLEFELPQYPIVGNTMSSLTVEGDKTFYFRAGDIISVAYDQGYVNMSVTESIYESNVDYTIITVGKTLNPNIDYTYILTEARGTRDGQILWKLVDNIHEIKYNWNNYVTFSFDVDVINE